RDNGADRTQRDSGGGQDEPVRRLRRRHVALLEAAGRSLPRAGRDSREALGGLGGTVLVGTVRWSSRGKDAESPDSGSIGATEDAASRRPAGRDGTATVSPSPPTSDRLQRVATRHIVACCRAHDQEAQMTEKIVTH